MEASTESKFCFASSSGFQAFSKGFVELLSLPKRIPSLGKKTY